MLTRLRISQYALIDDVEVAFGPGLNVLTGETGAGKSILVEGLALLLGGRASSTAIRAGADEATIEGLLVIGGEEVLVRRDVYRDRPSRSAIDGELATAKMLRQRVGGWVEIHGQRDDVLLLQRPVQRELLDAFAGAGERAERVAELAARLAALDRDREALRAAGREREERAGYLRSQIDELAAARLDPDEEEQLGEEALRLEHAAERERIAAEIHQALEGDDPALVSTLAVLERRAHRLAEIDLRVTPWCERLAAARYDLEELAREALSYTGVVENDPRRLAQIEERRDLIFHLKRKHGASIAQVLERGEEMAAELARLEADSVRGDRLEAERAVSLVELVEAAGALADARQDAADRLGPAVAQRLRALGMGDGRFEVGIARRPDPDGLPWRGEKWAWTRAGLEEVRFLIAPNAGEEPRPLSEIASGGELSRALLALEAALAEADATPTLVFDEIDAGIGGAVAHRVAAELAAVAAHHQVIVVTHLAQIAAVADRHLVVEKRRGRGRTVTTVREVAGEDRVAEVSRLLGGDPDRDVSRAHAEALLAIRR